jgi:sugar phosphate permease
MNAARNSSLRPWLVVGLLWVVAALNYLDRNMIATMHLSLKAAIPMTEAQFGLLTSSFLWVYGALSPLAGFLADRFSRSRVILASLLAWSLLTWLTGHAKSFEQLILVRGLMGISEACYIPAALALIADYHRQQTRSLATGVHMSGIMVGGGLGGLGGWLADRHDWTYAFNFFGILGVLYAIVLVFILRDAPREQHFSDGHLSSSAPGFLAALKNLLGKGSFWLLLSYWGLLGLVGWAIVGWMPTYLNENFHLSQGEAGLSATGFVQAAALVGVLLGGFWADRWSNQNRRACILVPAIGLLIAAPGILLVSTTSVYGAAMIGLVVFGLTRSFSDANTMPILCLVADSRYRATGYGILNFFACIVGGITIYAGGLLKDSHVDLRRVFQVAAASLVVCSVLLFLIKPAPSLIEPEEIL